MRKYISSLILFIVFSFVWTVAVYGAIVKTVKSLDGKWKIVVDGEDYFIRGIEYSADTVGQRPESNDWMHSDINDNGEIDGPYDSWVDYDRDNFQSPEEYKVGDFALLKAMGVNTIRIYHCENVNKELLRDLYKRFGIMVIMGNLLGAYTKGSEADWNEGTDYKNAAHRYNMKENIRKMVMEHKDEPYLLMWMLGNENDSPGDEANSTKTNTNAGQYPNEFAAFVNSICEIIKNLDPNHPVGICNATLRYLPNYSRYAPQIDILGFNQYSGPYGFGVLWNSVKENFDRPVLISEYGCDSYNTSKAAEDELYQSKYHSAAWKDIEKNSFWDDGIGNAIGGVVYCWLDKWWLVGSAKVHDIDIGTWNGPTNDGLFNDEWLGIVSQGAGLNSPFQRQLKEVYYTYQEDLWAEKNDITKKKK